MSQILSSLGIAALGLVAFGLLLRRFEGSFIYFPDPDVRVRPAEVGLEGMREVALQTEDGLALAGWYLPPTAGRPVLLLFNGNAGNRSYRLARLAHWKARLGVGALLFDYRGYGENPGSPSEEGLYRDGRAAATWLAKNRPAGSALVYFGESLGGAVALATACSAPPDRLVLESTFTCAPDLAYRIIPLFPARWFMRTRYDNLARIATLACPVLVLHGTEDEVVPFDHGRRLAAAARSGEGAGTRFFGIPGAHHCDTFKVGGDPYWAELRGFVDGAGGA
ncbi:MAG: alpha/beta hydrolase [Planctomycetes bacterium]|nr:alpha/beta hydrolase [Planctomycetota bacterium]